MNIRSYLKKKYHLYTELSHDALSEELLIDEAEAEALAKPYCKRRENGAFYVVDFDTFVDIVENNLV